jgi:hypothetical protein
MGGAKLLIFEIPAYANASAGRLAPREVSFLSDVVYSGVKVRPY